MEFVIPTEVEGPALAFCGAALQRIPEHPRVKKKGSVIPTNGRAYPELAESLP